MGPGVVKRKTDASIFAENRLPKRVSAPLCRRFHAIALLAFSARFPDDALRPELTITARIRTRLTVLETVEAITDVHFVTGDPGLPVRVISALHFLNLPLRHQVFLI